LIASYYTDTTFYKGFGSERAGEIIFSTGFYTGSIDFSTCSTTDGLTIGFSSIFLSGIFGRVFFLKKSSSESPSSNNKFFFCWAGFLAAGGGITFSYFFFLNISSYPSSSSNKAPFFFFPYEDYIF
jgi:hypothetical protein